MNKVELGMSITEVEAIIDEGEFSRAIRDYHSDEVMHTFYYETDEQSYVFMFNNFELWMKE